MSTYEEEHGEYILPASAVIPVRNAITRAMNQERTNILGVATKIYEYLLTPDGKKQLKEFRKRTGQVNPWDLEVALSRRFGIGRNLHTVFNLLFQPKDGKQKLVKPKKKDIPPYPLSTTWGWNDDEASVRINPASRQLIWHVERNNHAVEKAHNKTLGKAAFEALRNIQWPPGQDPREKERAPYGGTFNYGYGRSAEYNGILDAASTQAIRRTKWGPRTGGSSWGTDEYAEEAAMDYGGDPMSYGRHGFGPLGVRNDQWDLRSGTLSRTVRNTAKKGKTLK